VAWGVNMRDWWEKAIFWLEAHSRWNQLKALGSSNLVRASILMPAFGYMLLLNEQVHQYLTIKYDGWLLNYLPNVWRIWLLFYGSFFLAVATILYSLFCPPEVKRYSSAFEMADGEAQHQYNMGQSKMVQDYVKRLYADRPEWMKAVTDPKGLNFNFDVQNYTDPKGALSTYFIHQWTLRNIQRRGLRIFLYLLFAIGLALIAIPAGITFLQVTSLPVKHLFQ